MTRMTIKEVSERLGICPEIIRKQMRQGKLPIGKVIPNEKRQTYVFYKEWLEAYEEGGMVNG